MGENRVEYERSGRQSDKPQCPSVEVTLSDSDQSGSVMESQESTCQSNVVVESLLKESPRQSKVVVESLLEVESAEKSIEIKVDKTENKLGLSWAKLSHSWGLKLEIEVKV